MLHQEMQLIAPGTAMFRGAPRWRYRRLVSEYIKLAKETLEGNFDKKFQAECEISFLDGYLAEVKANVAG